MLASCACPAARSKSADIHANLGAIRGMFVEAVTTQEGFASLEQDWNRLSQASDFPNVFTTFDWFRAWNERFSGETRRGRRHLNILVLRKDGAVVGISPLVGTLFSRFGFTIRRLEFVERVADYNDLVVGDGSVGQIEAVVEFLARASEHWDLIDLRDLREAGSTIVQLESALAGAKLPYRSGPEEKRCPYMPIDACWAEMVGKQSPSARHVFRKQQRRLNRLSTQGIRVRVIEDPGREPGLLERMVALEAQKRVQGQLSLPFLGKYQDVFQSLFDTLGPRGWFSVALIEMGQRLLAYRICFRCGQEIWDYSTAYDHNFARLSPGTMLVPAMVDYGFAHGFQKFDFLRGEEPYKMRWARDFRQRHRLQIWNRRWISRLRKAAYFDLWPGLRRLLP
jgi:CelD/BcsL family acetyltransferase involved in cellulose biosynthesis